MKQLEKWYVWDGKGKPPNGVSGIILRIGKLVVDSEKLFHMAFWEWQYGPDDYDFGDIVAYTKGEKVESKRLCAACNGKGGFETQTMSKAQPRIIKCKCKRGGNDN